jgi:cellulose synthase (UDP-forming)
VPLCSPRQRAPLFVAMVAWLAAALYFTRWWLEPGHTTTVVGLVINSAVIGIELVVLPAWFFFFVLRLSRPNPDLPLPGGRVAIVVTKAPSEPWPVVRKTLLAMLSQEFPRAYDVWLADEDPAEETIAWCTDRGVGISSRKGIAEYHQPRWPRRTRCKEGNLAYFYDKFGYEAYDFVAQLDADHVPAPDYLRQMVAPFIDPAVGYVAAPSICDANADRSWAARGRLYSESVLHGPTQAGSGAGFAPCCIGSHYAVRTAALAQIGGLGPELAEDFSTTLLMNAGGWQGAFAIDAIAHGDGPECTADCITQDFQWARSMTNVLLRIAPHHIGKVPLRARLKLAFCLLWYPLNGMTMTTMVALPVISLISREPLMRVSLGGFYLHLLPGTLVVIGGMLWLKRLATLRPENGNPLRWEAILFQFVRWPWAFIGCLQSVAGTLTGHEFNFKVTPKGQAGTRPLPTRVLIPYLAIAVISLLPALVIRHAGAAGGYYFWSLMNGAIYLAVAVVVVLLHRRENPATTRRSWAALLARPKAVTIGATLSALLGATAMHGAQAISVVFPAAASAHSLERLPHRGPLELGVTTEALADNTVIPWNADELDQVARFEHDARAHAGIVMWYVDWAHSNITLGQLETVAALGSTPEITWEPWDATLGNPQPQYSLASIIDGSHDALIRSVATTLREFGRPVLLRFAQEMNGTWYPWTATGKHGFSPPSEYVAAWRHVHDIFAAVGATNVLWVWAPVTGYFSPRLYPGNRYVDVLGVSGFNGGSILRWAGGWRSFPQIFSSTLRALRRLAPGKPIQISEVASADAGGSKAAWIRQMFSTLEGMPYVTSLVWFNDVKQADWPIESSPGAVAAFAAGARQLVPP